MAGHRQDQALQIFRETGVGREPGDQIGTDVAYRFAITVHQFAQEFVASPSSKWCRRYAGRSPQVSRHR